MIDAGLWSMRLRVKILQPPPPKKKKKMRMHTHTHKLRVLYFLDEMDDTNQTEVLCPSCIHKPLLAEKYRTGKFS